MLSPQTPSKAEGRFAISAALRDICRLSQDQIKYTIFVDTDKFYGYTYIETH